MIPNVNVASLGLNVLETALLKNDFLRLLFSSRSVITVTCDIEGGPANLAMAKKVTISKKSTIFVLSS